MAIGDCGHGHAIDLYYIITEWIGTFHHVPIVHAQYDGTTHEFGSFVGIISLSSVIEIVEQWNPTATIKCHQGP
jgi:hypothetical protein